MPETEVGASAIFGRTNKFETNYSCAGLHESVLSSSSLLPELEVSHHDC